METNLSIVNCCTTSTYSIDIIRLFIKLKIDAITVFFLGRGTGEDIWGRGLLFSENENRGKTEYGAQLFTPNCDVFKPQMNFNELLL